MQAWAEYDLRNTEFINLTTARKPETMSDTASVGAPETVQVEHSSFSCDGGGGALGHPKVHLTLDQSGQVDCGYCGLHFELKPGASADSGH